MISIDRVIWGNSIRQWLIALLVAGISFGVLMLVKRLVITRVKKVAERTHTDVDDFLIRLVEQTKDLFFLALALYIGMQYLVFVDKVIEVTRIVVLVILILQGGFWANSLVSFWVNREVKKSLENGNGDSNTLSVLGVVIKGVIWAIVVVLVLDNIPGVNVNTLIASLGITGIAVGLAVQNILGDLFASLSIALDRPFVIGDSIVVDDLTGTIEKIGLKSTRVRSLSGEQIIFSNSDLLKSRIRNYQRMQRRRVVMLLSVDYSTPAEKLKAIPEMLKEIIENVEGTTFARSHLAELGDFAINFETVYWVESDDYGLFMEMKQQVLSAVLARFQAEGINIPFPTQTIRARIQQ